MNGLGDDGSNSGSVGSALYPGAHSPRLPSPMHTPLEPYTSMPLLDEDPLMIGTKALEEFLDEWRPEGPFNLPEPKRQTPGAVQRPSEDQRPSAQRDSTIGGDPPVPATAENRRAWQEKQLKAAAASTPSSPACKKNRVLSNSWWKRQRQELMDLRKTSKVLALELERLKLGRGIKSTLPLDARVRVGGARASPDLLVVTPPGTSWREATQRESLARQSAEVENARLRNIVKSQTRYARKLRRALRGTLDIDGMARTLGVPRNILRQEPQRSPQDNASVFARLLAGLDDSYAKVDQVLRPSDLAKLPCPGQTSRRWVKTARGLHAEIIDRYRVPFDEERTAQAIWKAMSTSERQGCRVLYAELIEFDENTSLTFQRKLYEAGPLRLELLFRAVCRKYIERGRTVFVQHRSVMTSQGGQLPISVEDITTRILVRSELQTHSLGASTDVLKASQHLPGSLERWHLSLTRFNHAVEDVVLSSSSSSITLTGKDMEDR